MEIRYLEYRAVDGLQYPHLQRPRIRCRWAGHELVMKVKEGSSSPPACDLQLVRGFFLAEKECLLMSLTTLSAPLRLLTVHREATPT